jgi:hypothetical protein
MLDSLQDILSRQWSDLMARPSGPMSFRFLLQPTMAAIAAIRDGRIDARTGRSPYFWTILTHAGERAARVREGFTSTARIIFLGLAMDAIYQFIAFRKFYPGEAIIIALALAVLPYFLIRGPAARITRWWNSRRPSRHTSHPKQ